jgi:hypothetical protein
MWVKIPTPNKQLLLTDMFKIVFFFAMMVGVMGVEECGTLEADVLVPGAKFKFDKDIMATSRTGLVPKRQIVYYSSNNSNTPTSATCTLVKSFPLKWDCSFFDQNGVTWNATTKNLEYNVRFSGLTAEGEWTPLKGSLYVVVTDNAEIGFLASCVMGLMIMISVIGFFGICGGCDDGFVLGMIIGSLLDGGSSGGCSSSD